MRIAYYLAMDRMVSGSFSKLFFLHSIQIDTMAQISAYLFNEIVSVYDYSQESASG